MPPKETDESLNTDGAKNPRRFRMVAVDLDGTLLQSNRKISQATRDYLVELHCQGILVCICTGRSVTAVYEYVRHLSLPSLPVVCSNGARGIQCSVGSNDDVSVKELFCTHVPKDVAEKTIALSQEMGYMVQCCIGAEIYADPREPHHFELTQYRQVTGNATIIVTDAFQKALQQGLPSKMIVFCPNVLLNHQEQDAMMDVFEKRLFEAGVDATVIRGSRSLGWSLEILHADVNKGHGLRNMCKHLKVDLDHVVAFGDEDNDIEFLQLAGRGIAMGNGREAVKKVADQICEYTNDEDGVLKILQRIAKEGELVLSLSAASSST